MEETRNGQTQSISEEAKKIVAAIKERTAMPAYELVIQKDSQPGIFASKFGGVPYWDLHKDYPKNASGEKMMLLAQINFTAAKLNDERLPKEGMLQFFIQRDDIFGADFDEPDVQNTFRIVYHENIDETVTKEQVLELSIPVCTDEDEEYTPVFKETSVDIQRITASMGTNVTGYDKLFRSVVLERLHEHIGELPDYKYLDEPDYNYLMDELSTTGHRILGYPFFTQSDPRSDTDYYDTLLFQMDSEMGDGEDYILWGDCGVANFFINSEALEKKDFSKVLYNWDCC